IEQLGGKPFRARQLMNWIYKRGVDSFAGMTDLAKQLRARLDALAEVRAPEILSVRRSADGTRKWLLRADASQAFEMVFIPEPDRGTLCISSQVGCALDCSFCATAQQGFNRNLCTAEIIGQVWLAERELAREARGARTARAGADPGADPGARREGRQVTNVALAVSLHAPDDALRNELVPINRKHPIAELLDACWHYLDEQNGRSVTFEYVMLDGVNDSPAQARSLAQRLKGHPAKVNLIPFNPFPGTRYRRSPAHQIQRFRDELIRQGVLATVRRPRGDDIDAACGQLAGR